MRKAMIFAAGLGTRLKPLTDDKPKALVKLAGKTLLQRTIEKLIKTGVTYIVINIHHFPELMRKAIDKLDYPGIEFIISDESTRLYDTGGGLLKAAKHLDGTHPFIVHNVDIVSNINLNLMYEQHLKNDALVSLAVSSRQSTRYFLWHENRLCGWKNIQTGNQITCYPTSEPPVAKAFSGIHIINPEIFGLIHETGKFSINQLYLRLANSHNIIPYSHNPDLWADVGTTEKHAHANQMIVKNPENF